MARSRAWLLVLAVPAAVLGALVLLVLAVLWALRPAPADEELVAWAAQRERSAERSLAVRTERGVEGGCGLRIRVQLPDGQPAADVPVEVVGYLDSQRLFVQEDYTEPEGILEYRDLPCGYYQATAHPLDLVPDQEVLELGGERRQAEVLLVLREGMVVQGRVLGSDGAPVAEAEVSSWMAETTSDAGGHYSVTIPPTDEVSVWAKAFGYDQRRAVKAVEAPEPGLVVEVDITLPVVRHVRVFCAGMPEDRCGDVFLSCTESVVPVGESCTRPEEDQHTICTCPEGNAAVRGGGRSVLIDPGETEAWLDFRDTGSIVGQLTYEGEPASGCTIAVVRIPNGLEDIPRGLFAARRVVSGFDGSFEVVGVVDGDWQLEIQCMDPNTGDQLERSTTPMRVKPRVEVDVGVIELLGGGSIEGMLLDGLTGEPMAHHPIMGLREAGQSERRAPAIANSEQDGSFTMSGLPPGTWTLAHPLSPHMSTSVVVEDGVITDGVVIETSEATALAENGFEVMGVDEDLVVSAVEEGGPAWEAGLQEGDVVETVLIAGFDLGGMLGDHSTDLARLVLGQWDGPGVTLVVDRDGEAVEVPLEW